MSVNKAILIGHLGADPETRSTQAGKAVTNFSIATSEKWKDKVGVPQEKTEWHRIVVFGRQAEACQQYLHKGKQVYIEGRIQTRQWEDKDGNTRYMTEVVAQTVRFLGGSQQPRDDQSDFDRNAPQGSDQGPPPISDDDVPF